MKGIKRIIFDLDDTLIPWKPEYSLGFKKALKDFNLNYDNTDEDLVSYYESIYPNYNYEAMLKTFNEFTGLNASIDFILAWQKYLGEMAEPNDEINDVLEYLSKKYDLVVLTNWFRDPQAARLAKARMRNYFSAVYGADNYKKPSKESFKVAIGDLEPNECIMIGDNYKEDIEGALNCGLKAIYLTSKEGNFAAPTIKSLKELKEIL